MIAGNELAGRNAQAFRVDEDRSTVFIATGDHQNVVASEAVVASESVCREVCANDLPNVSGAFRIRPCDADKNMFIHNDE